VVAIGVALSGCSDLKKASDDVKSTTKRTKRNLKNIQQHMAVDPLVNQKFTQILGAYKAYNEKQGRGPANWRELKQGGGMAMIGSSWIDEARREGYTVVFGQPLLDYIRYDDAFHVLAYDQNTTTRGGWVLFGDGTMEKISAKEFKELTKIGDAPPAQEDR
jgi:hypothetical protein